MLTKSTLKKKAFISARNSQITPYHWGKSETWKQELEQSPWRNIAYWFGSHVLLTRPAFYSTRTICAQGWHCPQWDKPSLTSYQSRKYPTDNLKETSSQLNFPLSRHHLTVSRCQKTSWHNDTLHPISCHYNITAQMPSHMTNINDGIQIQ